MSMIALAFAGSTLTPLVLTMNPNSFPADDPKEVNLGTEDDPKHTKIGVPSTSKLGRSLIHLLKEYVDVFA